MAWDPFALFKENSEGNTCSSKINKAKYVIKPLSSNKNSTKSSPITIARSIVNKPILGRLVENNKNSNRIVTLPASLSSTKENQNLEDDLVVLKKIIEVLFSEEYDFHTLRGISKQLDIPEETINSVLKNNYPFIRKSNAKDKNDNDLYTLSSHPVKLREKIATLSQSLVNG